MTLARELSRSLGLTVSTTNCVGLRKDPYKFRLGLVYDYLIEYNAGGGGNEEVVEPDLIGIENAVAYGVAAALDDCDTEQSPLYSVELASRHRVFEDGFCAPVDQANDCQVIRGYTEIRLDSIAPTVELAAYSAIESVLHEPLFLNQFVSMPYARVDFVRSVDQVLETNEQGSDQQSTLSWVAIAAAILSIALIAIFFAGFWRKQLRSKARTKKKKKNLQVESPIGKKRFLLGSVPRKYYELDEEAGGADGASGFKMVEIMEPGLENPSVTWSISDITSSESGSILSNLSKTTSKLERIEEEDNESQTDDEWDGDDTYETYDDDDDNGRPTYEYTDSIPLEYLYDISAGSASPSASPRHHVDAFDYAMEESADPEGCRYIEDSSEDDEAEEPEEEKEDEEVLQVTTYDENNVGFDRSVQTVAVTDEGDEESNNVDEEPSCPSLSSLLNSSDDTVETSNESRVAVLYDSTTNTTTNTTKSEDEETQEVQKWLVELVKELRKSQRRKLLTYNQD